MLTLKLQYQDSESVAHMKTSYAELTYLELCELFKNSQIEDEYERLYANIALLSGIDIEIAKQFDLTTSICVVPFLEWIDQVPEPPECKHKVQIGAEAWGKLEQAKMVLKYGDQYEVATSIIEVIKVYLPMINISLIPALESLSIAKWFENQIVEFFNKYKKLNEWQPTGDQLNAGIEDLGKYGYMNTLDALCFGDALKHDEMLDKSADVIYFKLEYDYVLSTYRERLTDIQSKKK